MSRLMGKRVRIGKYAIPALLLISLAVGTVAAAVYVVLTWTMSLTVVANPRVHFWKWSPPGSANTFTESFNIFPNIKTIQDNATYGINSVTAGACGMRIFDITTPANIESVYIKVFNSTATILEKTWTGSPISTPTAYESFTTATGNKYTIWLEVTGTSGASGSSVVTFDMKVESP